MDFDRLRAFVWTLEDGNITAAARRLCRTQPAVSRMLQALEQQVGAELIDRRARPLRPTATGRRVLEYARDILRAADRLNATRIQTERQRQALRLGVSRSLVWHLRDRRFLDSAGPLGRTDFDVRSGWSQRLYRRFARGDFDCAVLLMPNGWSADVPCRAERLRAERLTVVGPRPKGAPLRRRATLHELHDVAWVLNPDGCGFRQTLARALASIGHQLHVQFELDAAPQEHLGMAAAGIGCTIVPRSVLTQAVTEAERVQQFVVEGLDCDLDVWIVWSPRCRLLPGTQESLAAVFAQPPVLTTARPVAS